MNVQPIVILEIHEIYEIATDTKEKKKGDDTSEEEEKINYTFEIIVITDQVIGIFSVKSSALKEPSLVSNVTKVILFGGIGFFLSDFAP